MRDSRNWLLTMAADQLGDAQSGTMADPSAAAIGAAYGALLSALSNIERARIVDHPNVWAAELGAQRVGLADDVREEVLALIRDYYKPARVDSARAIYVAYAIVDMARRHAGM